MRASQERVATFLLLTVVSSASSGAELANGHWGFSLVPLACAAFFSIGIFVLAVYPEPPGDPS